MSAWEKLLERPHPRGHFVQFYETDETSLARNVANYLWAGLRLGEGVLMVTTAEHSEQFLTHLEEMHADAALLRDSGRLVQLDAHETLAKFMVSGRPDWWLFEKAIRSAMRRVEPAADSTGLRAYGEMVDILWKSGQRAAAIRVEQLWNRLLEQSSFSLYCAYSVDMLGEDVDVASLEEVLCTHTHVVPSSQGEELEMAIQRAIDEVLGSEADELRVRMRKNWAGRRAVMPSADALSIWLRKHMPDRADRIIRRAREIYRGSPQADELAYQ